MQNKFPVKNNQQDFQKPNNPNFVYKKDNDFGIVKNTEYFDKKETPKLDGNSLKNALAGLKLPRLAEKKEGVKIEKKPITKKEIQLKKSEDTVIQK